MPTTDAKTALAARGFGTFKRWARENRKAAAEFRNRKGTPNDRARAESLARCLDSEYTELIRPNL